MEATKAVILASGSSLQMSGVMDVIARYEKPDLAILVTDRSLSEVLKKGITPDKFPFFYSCIQENLIPLDGNQKGQDLIVQFFCQEIVYPFTQKITLFCGQMLEPERVQTCADMGFQIRRFNRFGKGAGKGPVLKTCGNNGMALMEIAKHVLNIPKVGFIGLDLDYSTSWKVYADPKTSPDLRPAADRMLRFSREQIFNDFKTPGSDWLGRPVYSLSRLGRLHGTGIIETTIHDFLKD